MSRIMELKLLADRLSSRLSENHKVIDRLMPIAGLNMAHNHIVFTYEVASYYQSVLPMPKRGSLEDFLRDEEGTSQRIIGMLNSCFVSVVSSLESCARKAVRSYSHLYGHVGNTIYLNNIMQRSRKIGWISPADEAMWLNLIKVRNAIVHNNGEGQKNEWFELPSGLIWEARIGLQFQVTLRHITESLEWMLLAYARWCNQLLVEWSAWFDYAPQWNKPYSYHLSASRIIPPWGADLWAGYGAWSWRSQPEAS